jgi:hypothetical protein
VVGPSRTGVVSVAVFDLTKGNEGNKSCAAKISASLASLSSVEFGSPITDHRAISADTARHPSLVTFVQRNGEILCMQFRRLFSLFT